MTGLSTTTITPTEWTLRYSEGSAGNVVMYSDNNFIKNGIANFGTLPHTSGHWFSQYTIDIPQEIVLNLDTDSLKVVANLKNSIGDDVANEIDLSFLYKYNPDTLTASASWQKGVNPSFCLIGITYQVINNVSEQLTDPSVYAEYAVGVQGNKVSSYKNSTLLKSVSYTGSTGTVKGIAFTFRGNGEADWVRIYKGDKLIMSEDFNIDGTTSATWTKYN